MNFWLKAQSSKKRVADVDFSRRAAAVSGGASWRRDSCRPVDSPDDRRASTLCGDKQTGPSVSAPVCSEGRSSQTPAALLTSSSSKIQSCRPTVWSTDVFFSLEALTGEEIMSTSCCLTWSKFKVSDNSTEMTLYTFSQENIQTPD